MKRLYQLLALLALTTISVSVLATPISRYARFTGNYNYVVTGGSLRTQPNSVAPCTLGTTSAQTLSGIPVGSTIVAAYLYWGGSGSTVDSSVSLNGNTVIADRTFTTIPAVTGTTYFGGTADVTARVAGNGSFTFGNLSVDSSNTYCSNSSVMAAWSLLVVYTNNSEPLRAINIFDGLDSFYNSSLSLTPDGFRIPASGINGQMTAITWEGDPDLGGASETLNFNGSVLDAQGYDSLSHFSAGGAGTTTNGVDVDTYNISSLLSPGQTSGSTYYSAGGDLVFLTAQIISVTSEPQVDLSITKSHTGNFSVGSNAAYTVHVANELGVQQVDYPVTVSDVLPTGLTYVSGVGTGWTCGASGQTVTCTHAAPLASGSAFPDITLTVAVGNAAYPSITNTATVTSAGSTDNITSNNTDTDTATVLGSNLSTSTKTVSDLNGGEANAGDTLRYTITLINSTAIVTTGASVTDNVPGNISNFNVVSIPGGAINSSTGVGTGANSTGYLNIAGINVPANGNVTVIFDVVIAAGTSPGATIDNTATITNPAGTGATPSANQVVVSPSLIAGSGNKQLYLWSSPAQTLSRTRPTGAHSTVTVTGGGNTTWNITPVLQKSLILKGGSGVTGNFSVYLLLHNTGNSTGNTRNVTVTLLNGSTALASATQTVTATTTSTLRTFTLNLPSNVTIPAGSTLSLQVSNSAASGRSIAVTPYNGGTYSFVELNSLTVINVDSVQTYTAAYASSVAGSSFMRGNTVYVRAVVSDPFGSFDISSATITLRDPTNTDVVVNAAMTSVNDSGAALKTYEYAYAIPTGAVAGAWNARITANEGVEGVTDLGIGTFTVTIPMPALQVSKISDVISDPVNNTTNPKRIPGSIVRYTVTVSNTGPGAVDASSLVMTDALPSNTVLCVAASCGGVIQFSDGSTPSGLSFNYASNVTYSSSVGGGTPFTYTASADANGFDAAITGIRVAPTGALSAAGNGTPSFSIRFYVKVK